MGELHYKYSFQRESWIKTKKYEQIKGEEYKKQLLQGIN